MQWSENPTKQTALTCQKTAKKYNFRDFYKVVSDPIDAQTQIAATEFRDNQSRAVLFRHKPFVFVE